MKMKMSALVFFMMQLLSTFILYRSLDIDWLIPVKWVIFGSLNTHQVLAAWLTVLGPWCICFTTCFFLELFYASFNFLLRGWQKMISGWYEHFSEFVQNWVLIIQVKTSETSFWGCRILDNMNPILFTVSSLWEDDTCYWY